MLDFILGFLPEGSPAMSRRFDFTGWKRKISTWLGLASGMASLAIVTFAAWPQRVQDLTPDWFLVGLAALSVSSVLNPFATSFKQKGLEK
jgi:hypothetical protein